MPTTRKRSCVSTGALHRREERNRRRWKIGMQKYYAAKVAVGVIQRSSVRTYFRTIVPMMVRTPTTRDNCSNEGKKLPPVQPSGYSVITTYYIWEGARIAQGKEKREIRRKTFLEKTSRLSMSSEKLPNIPSLMVFTYDNTTWSFGSYRRACTRFYLFSQTQRQSSFMCRRAATMMALCSTPCRHPTPTPRHP